MVQPRRQQCLVASGDPKGREWHGISVRTTPIVKLEPVRDTVHMNACMNIRLCAQFLSQIVINMGMVMED